MTLISLDENQQTVSGRFRKAEYFAFMVGDDITIKQNIHKTSKSNEFFEYFNTLGVKKVYLKGLGYKTFLKLHSLGIDVYFVQGATNYMDIHAESLVLVDEKNAEELCFLGHHKK
ncbi:MAG TPA: hypothetical protein EYG94_07900 [Campylobacterales bacterium]|nr:hypothetical protein [Campylobacterales bacterium]